MIYRPETELASHYFRASLPRQFDEYIWFDDTRAIAPLETAEIAGLPDTYPFGVRSRHEQSEGDRVGSFRPVEQFNERKRDGQE